MGQEESRNEEMDTAQIQELCIIFMRECPSGSLHLHELRRIFGVPSSSVEEALFIETVFRSFDTNKDNTLDFLEYVAALHLIFRGNLEDRLKWSFKMYDKDGNGKLDKKEVKRIIRVHLGFSTGSVTTADYQAAVIRLMAIGHDLRIIYKVKLQTSEVSMSPSEICDRIFELVDQNHDGQITLSEFMEGAQKDEWVMNMLKLDINVTGWVNQNCWKKS